MKTLLIAFSGNPCTADDWLSLLAHIDKYRFDDILIHEKPLIGEPLDKTVIHLERKLKCYSPDRIIVVAYSWGCYLALRWLSKTSHSVCNIFLISPTLIAENPVSNALLAVTNLPLLGDMLLKMAIKEKAAEFVEKSFSPQTATSSQFSSLFTALNNHTLWKGAIYYKHQQQTYDISELKIPPLERVTVISGSQDISCNFSLQKQALLQLIPEPDCLSFHEIDDAGHGLIWTKPELLADIINRDCQVIQQQAASSIAETPHVDNNVVTFLKRHSLLKPDSIALRWVHENNRQQFNGNPDTYLSTEQVNFSELYGSIARTAQGFTDLGIDYGDRVIIFVPMSLEMYIAMFAIQHIGATAVFLDSWARRNHLGTCAKCVGPKAMISHEQAFDLIDDIPEFRDMPYRILAGNGDRSKYSAHLDELIQTNSTSPIVAVKPNDTALVTFTTGSSGIPKGANRTHKFLFSQYNALKDVIPYTDSDIDIPAFPIFSLNNLASGVLTFLPAIDLAHPSEHDSAALVSQIRDTEVSCTTLSPSMLNNLSSFCSQHDILLSSLRRVITGGAPISKDNVRDFKSIAPNAKIWILYGSTEVEPMAHIEADEMLNYESSSDHELIEDGVNVGRIAKGLRYKFIKPIKSNIDLTLSPWPELEVEKGAVGEFVVAGNHVCEGYYNNREAFSSTKICDSDGTIWHRTGDLARLDENNRLWIVGRVHNMIVRGEKFYFPVSAEIILKRFDHIKKGAFLGLPDETLGERTAIVVEFADCYTEPGTGVREILRLFEKNDIAVDSFYQVDKIPMDPRHHSKVEYGLLRKSLLQGKKEDMLCTIN